LPEDIRLGWSNECQQPLVTPFTGGPGLTLEMDENSDPIDYFKLFVHDDEFEMFAIETNRYFEQIRAVRQPKPYARMNLWYDTTAAEMKKKCLNDFSYGTCRKNLKYVIIGQQIHLFSL
jgi:hypothetical protein